jgi:hypothetical protein
MRLRQFLWSMAGFGLVVAAVVSVDQRVRDQFERFLWGAGDWDRRVMDLGNALMTALRYQSIENGPLLVFAAVGAVLFLFMVRT